jgi:hypothetical protein
MSEETRIAGTKIKNESPPKQGVTIRNLELDEVSEGSTVYLLRKGPNELAALERPFKVIKVGDQLVLQATTDELPEPERRRELAKAIVRSHIEEIKEQAVAATEEALARKPVEKLEKMQAAGKKGGKAKVTSQKGCMFLQIGETEETVL